MDLRRQRRTAAETLPPAAPPTTPASESLPSDLADADEILDRYEVFHQALISTHTTIPDLLRRRQELASDLGSAEIGRDVDAGDMKSTLALVVAELEAAGRRRAAAMAGLDELKDSLSTARSAIVSLQASFAVLVLQESRQAYEVVEAQAVEAYRTHRALAAALRSTIPPARRVAYSNAVPESVIPLPAPPQTLDHLSQQRFANTLPSILDVVNRRRRQQDAEAAEAGRPVTLPENIQRINAALDRLEQALTICGAIEAAKVADGRLQRMTDDPAAAAAGVYLVVKEFTCQLDQLLFSPGDLIDSSLLGPGSIRRLVTARYLRLQPGSSVGAAA